MIAAGAYWANRTWGSYWSWDPKETWAAITWLVYAGYLHMRITRGWRGRRAAYFAILGFARGDVYLLRRDVPVAWIARVCVSGHSSVTSANGVRRKWRLYTVRACPGELRT